MDQRERMKTEVERWRRSGLTQKEFSQQLGMKVATFIPCESGFISFAFHR